MLIKKLKVKNFKIFDDREFVFGKVNTIVGDNAMGKSSIAEAISFGLYGVTSCGSSRCDNLIKKDAARTVVEVVVELPGGKQRTIKRCKTKQKTEVYLDNEKVTQDTINKVLAGDPAGIDAQTFLAMFNPLYLLGLAESEQKKTREFITGLCVPPHRDEVLKKMDPDDATLLRESEWPDIAELRKKNNELKERNTSLTGQAELLRKREPVEAVSEDIIVKLKEELQSLQERKREIEDKIQEPRPFRPAIVDERTLEKQINHLRDAYKSLQGQLLQPPPRPEPGQKCPACGQKMPQHIHREALENWKREVERVNGINNELKAKLQQLCATGKELAAKLEQAREENKKALAKYERELAEWEKATASARREITDLNNRINFLQDELNEVKLTNERAAGYRESSKILAGIEIEMAQNESDIAYNEALINALNKFQVTRTEMIAEEISSNLSRVSLKLFEITKTTAEVKPVFKLLYDEKPTPFLSLSERIKAGIELSGMVRKLRGINVPLFVDNRESITKCNLDNESFQVFYASVSAGDELEVRND